MLNAFFMASLHNSYPSDPSGLKRCCIILSSCKLIDHPDVTGHAVGKSSLRLYLPTLDLAHQPHPGQDLRHGAGQGEVVRDIVIAACATLLFQTPPFQ